MFDIVGFVGAEEGQREREKDISSAVPFVELERPFLPPPPPDLTALLLRSRVYARSHRQPARRVYRSYEREYRKYDRRYRTTELRITNARATWTPSPGYRARTTAFTGVKFIVTRPDEF